MRRFPDIAPSRSSVMRRRMDVLEVRFGEGAVQRMPRFAGAVPGRQWQVVFSRLDNEDAARIDGFLEAHAGVSAFLWTPPGGVTGHYLCAAWQITPVSAAMADVSASFVEGVAATGEGT
ncbi:MAG: phage tail protein [Candidatus Puniceispirillaceae bacterium]